MNKNTVEAKVKVRYAETDQMGVVYHSNYLIWFEVGRSEYFRAIDCPYVDLEDKGIFFPVIEASCRYRYPARYGDTIVIQTTISKIKPTRIKLEYSLVREKDNKLLAEGYTTHAFVSKEGKPFNISKTHPFIWEKINQG